MNKIKFLILRFSSIGDIVLTSPVVRCIKEQVENAEPMQQDQSKNSAPCQDATMMASTIVGLSIALWFGQ